jgi:hypothetical protein
LASCPYVLCRVQYLRPLELEYVEESLGENVPIERIDLLDLHANVVSTIPVNGELSGRPNPVGVLVREEGKQATVLLMMGGVVGHEVNLGSSEAALWLLSDTDMRTTGKVARLDSSFRWPMSQDTSQIWDQFTSIQGAVAASLRLRVAWVKSEAWERWLGSTPGVPASFSAIVWTSKVFVFSAPFGVLTVHVDSAVDFTNPGEACPDFYTLDDNGDVIRMAGSSDSSAGDVQLLTVEAWSPSGDRLVCMTIRGLTVISFLPEVFDATTSQDH